MRSSRRTHFRSAECGDSAAERSVAADGGAAERSRYVAHRPCMLMRRPTSVSFGLLLVLGACRASPDELQRLAGDALRTRVPALQTAYWEQHGQYARHMRDLNGGTDTLASGILVIVHGNATGWSATASHPDVSGAACAAFFGEPGLRPVMRGRTEPRVSGLVTCTQFARWAKRRQIAADTIGWMAGTGPTRP